MNAFTSNTPFLSPDSRDWDRDRDLGNEVFSCCYDEESIGRGMQAVQAGVERHLPPLLRSCHRAAAPGAPGEGETQGPEEPYPGCRSPGTASYLASPGSSDHLHYSESDGNSSPQESRKRSRSGSSRHRLEVVTELGPEEVRWFYKEDKKTWKPFVGHDSLNIERMFRRLCELRAELESSSGIETEEGDPTEGADLMGTCEPVQGPGEGLEAAEESEVDLSLSIEPVCVRGGLYQVDVLGKLCYPVYWNRKF